MKSRFTPLILLVTLICTALTGCKPSSANPDNSGTDINIITSSPGASTQTLTPGVTSTPTITQTPTLTTTNTPQPSPTKTLTFSPTNTGTATQMPAFYEEEVCEEHWCTYPGHLLLSLPVSSQFHNEIDPFYPYGSTAKGVREPHHGVEFPNPTGTPVLAATKGIVIVAGNDVEVNYGEFENFYGNLIILEHQLPELEYPIFTLYAHLSSVNVEIGELIEKGDKIGTVGTSGAALGSHLHFEVRIKTNQYSSTTNPDLWLKYFQKEDPEVQNGTLVVRMRQNESSIYAISILIENFDDPSNPYHAPLFRESYDWRAPTHPELDENLVIGNLEPGRYRVSFNREGSSYKEFVEIEAGKITLVEFIIH